ncbi:MAG: hypothetical protein KKH61_21085 [Gammaproteobacteria bacterium]|nr:hypothetical protein [Gammaproteobacteria bacterium]
MALTFKIIAMFLTIHLLDLDPRDRNLKLGLVFKFGSFVLDTTWTLSW